MGTLLCPDAEVTHAITLLQDMTDVSVRILVMSMLLVWIHLSSNRSCASVILATLVMEGHVQVRIHYTYSYQLTVKGYA